MQGRGQTLHQAAPAPFDCLPNPADRGAASRPGWGALRSAATLRQGDIVCRDSVSGDAEPGRRTASDAGA